ncbi:hypothetical protein B296_00042559 [Ensete ventricosum]|uniref:Uncharacterized protein n=1 Tax=Ensete ventricosum TaxID=4639 RepID=A0A426YVQ9_ENSVE|nr:hypothetical protein B296_00042559 [Ensete ventricosum]
MLLSMGSLVGHPSCALGVNPSIPPLRSCSRPLLFRRRRQFLDLGAASTSPASAVARNGLKFLARFAISYRTSISISCRYGTYRAVPTHDTLRYQAVPSVSVLCRTDMYRAYRTVGVVSDYDLLALDSISGFLHLFCFPKEDESYICTLLFCPGSGRADTSMFPEVDSTWKVGIITRGNVVRAALQIKHEMERKS